MTINRCIAGLIDQAINTELIDARDVLYACNRVLRRLELETYTEDAESPVVDTIPNILEAITDWAIQTGVIEDVLDDKEKLMADIMDCFVARPSVINATFYEKYAQSPKQATDYFYQLSRNSNYIQTKRIANNIQFNAETNYGVMDITINLSKPEKDPAQLQRERAKPQDVTYPLCALCKENEGYGGRTGHPARANHRLIEVGLLGEDWYFQYSPYVYYNEHSIVLSGEHRPMAINRNAFGRLLEFTKKFPHYFIGSNADLPIVGGSILTHDHYQAGRYEFAMTRAEDAFEFDLNEFAEVKASVLHWPMSVIRLQSEDTEILLDAAEHVRETWDTYQDEQAGVYPFTNETPHNTVTPIARRRDQAYELDLVLRNNRTSAEHPMGIFHPHEDVQHIKKENIGLIEVMGLAVLPARLKTELEDIKAYVLGRQTEVEPIHQHWADELKQTYPDLESEAADDMMEYELARKFTKVLEDSGVLKDNEAYQRFITTLNA